MDVHRGQAGPPSQRLDLARNGQQPRSVPAPQGQVVTFLREHHRDSPADLARRSDDQSLPRPHAISLAELQTVPVSDR